MSILRVDNVGLAVSLRQILQDISLELEEGDRLVLLGASGSGKSSLLQLFNALQSPSYGKLSFLEKAYSEYSPVTLRQQIALIPQEAKLLGMTVKDAILYPLNLQKIQKKEIQRRWLFWQEQLDLPAEWLDRNEALLSGGQKQWVAIARGLITEPKILLLDEPTSALDIGRSKKLADLLLNAQQQLNIPMVVATHEFDFAQQFANKIIYLECGKIEMQQNTPDIDWSTLKQKLISLAKTKNTDGW